jgi:putative hydrolase of HD superfamily
MSNPTIARIAQLQQLIADFSCVYRMPQLADKGRAENDTEHSYGLALTAWFLAKEIAPELDHAKVLKYALTHDLVELHAGDTFVFAKQKDLDSKSDREDAAIEKISKDWSDFHELAAFAKAYKEKTDEEAKFVYAVDKMLPVLMVNLGEKDSFWSKHKITREMQMKEKEPKMKASAYVAPYYDLLVEWMSNPDYFYKPE